MNLPNLLVRLHHDTGVLPAGIAIQFPRRIACAFIRRRDAAPVGDLNITPDLSIDGSQLRFTGIPWLDESGAIVG